MQRSLMVLSRSRAAGSNDGDAGHNEVVSSDELRADCAALCDELNIALEFRHTGDADELARWIAEDGDSFDGLIVDPGGHGSPGGPPPSTYGAALQAFADRSKPVVEVHLDNFYRRLPDITRPPPEVGAARGIICGFGKRGYAIAIRAIARKFSGRPAT